MPTSRTAKANNTWKKSWKIQGEGKKQRERHKETKRGRKATKLDHNYKLDIRDTIKQKRHIWLHSITGKDKTLKMRKIQ